MTGTATRSGGEKQPLARARWLAAAESREILDALAADGRPARFVGGCVRDTLLDPRLDPHDLDLATPERPERAMALLEARGIKVVPTGLSHGTVTALRPHHAYEVTTLRRDVATDGRRAVVAFTEDFVEDAARRDFTINAMSCDEAGQLFDPFGGRADLAAGRIRFVGEPRQRIREDYLRILRWFRFFGRFGREPPDEPALAACAAEAGGTGSLSGERVRKELFATLRLARASRAFELMVQTGVLRAALAVPLATTPLDAMAALRLGDDPVLALAAMLRAGDGRAADAKHLAARLRLSRADAARLANLAAAPPAPLDAGIAAHRRQADAAGPAVYADCLRLAAIEAQAPEPLLHQLLHELRVARPPPFPLDGEDVLASGVPPGPEVGRLLAAVRNWWRSEDFRPDRDACLAHLTALRGATPSA